MNDGMQFHKTIQDLEDNVRVTLEKLFQQTWIQDNKDHMVNVKNICYYYVEAK